MANRLLTIATGHILPYCLEILQTQKEYADKHHLDYSVATELLWRDLHPSFSKVWEVKKAFNEGAERVIWADADVAFTNYHYDLMALVDNDNYFMAAYHQLNWKSWVYLCNGLFVMKNDARSNHFLDDWIQRIESRKMKDHPWEQWYFDEIIRETNWFGCRVCDADEIGCFSENIWHDGAIWRPGLPTVHLAGPASWPKRREVFLRDHLPYISK